MVSIWQRSKGKNLKFPCQQSEGEGPEVNSTLFPPPCLTSGYNQEENDIQRFSSILKGCGTINTGLIVKSDIIIFL